MSEFVDESNHVVNFSGGRTSAYMVYLFEQIKKQHNINVEYVYCDTGAEHPKTYEFINNCVEFFGIELTCIRGKAVLERGKGFQYDIVKLEDCKQDLVPFLEVLKKHGTPTIAAPLCSDRMKAIPADKYCNDKYGRRNYTKWLGMRIDEPKRIAEVNTQIDMFMEKEKTKKPPVIIEYLAHISDFEKQDILDFWETMPFNLELEEHLGNCVFCIKKGANKVALAERDEPEMAKEFVKMIWSAECIESQSRELPRDIMYRDYHSLESIIATYSDYSREDIAKTIRANKAYEAGSCSESCEPSFSLFDESFGEPL